MNERADLLRRALILSALSIAMSVLVGLTAVVVAVGTGGLSLLGFGLDAAIDGAASVVLVWRFRIETQHPHRAERVERLAEVAVGVVLMVLAAYLAINAVLALLSNAHPDSSTAALAILVVSLALLPALAVAKYRTARRLGSGALRADSILTGIAAVLALISLVGLGLTWAAGLTWADAVGALVVAVILAREGWFAIKGASTPAD